MTGRAGSFHSISIPAARQKPQDVSSNASAIESSGAPGSTAFGSYRQPEDGVLLFGEMFFDVATIEHTLRTLPFDISGYRGRLRVILAAARRIEERAVKLLGDEEDAGSKAKGASA